MSDQGRWFKLWTTAPYDPDLGSLSLDDFARWCLFGTYLKTHGTNGTVLLSKPALPIQHLLRVQSFEDIILAIEKFPNCTVTLVTNATVTYKVEWRNWLKYQGDYSGDRVERFRVKQRDAVTAKKRREERRGEEKKELKDSSAVPSNGDGPAPTTLPDWFVTVLKASPVFAMLLAPKYTRFWSTMSATFDPYEWLAWDEEVHKADAWIATHPQRKPRCPDRFLLNWFQRAVDHGRIQRAKEEGVRRAAESR